MVATAVVVAVLLGLRAPVVSGRGSVAVGAPVFLEGEEAAVARPGSRSRRCLRAAVEWVARSQRLRTLSHQAALSHTFSQLCFEAAQKEPGGATSSQGAHLSIPQPDAEDQRQHVPSSGGPSPVGGATGGATGGAVGLATGAAVGLATGAAVRLATGAAVGLATGAAVGLDEGAGGGGGLEPHHAASWQIVSQFSFDSAQNLSPAVTTLGELPY